MADWRSLPKYFERFVAVGRVSRPLREQLVELGNDDRINDLGAGGLQFRDCFIENFSDFFEIFRIRLGLIAHRLAQDADAWSFQAVLIERLRIAAWNIANATGCKRILRIVAHHAV